VLVEPPFFSSLGFLSFKAVKETGAFSLAFGIFLENRIAKGGIEDNRILK